MNFCGKLTSFLRYNRKELLLISTSNLQRYLKEDSKRYIPAEEYKKIFKMILRLKKS